MSTDREILDTLKEMHRSQQAMLARQEEALALLREQAERSTRIGEEAIRLQRVAVERAHDVHVTRSLDDSELLVRRDGIAIP